MTRTGSIKGNRVFGAKTIITAVSNTTTTGTLELHELSTSGQNKVSISAPDSLSADYSLTLPEHDGNNNQVLTTDGSGTLTWTDQSGGDGDITSVVAGDGLTGGATSGDATLNVNVDDSTIETNSDTLRIKDSGVTLAKMSNLANMKVIGNTSGGSAIPSAVSILDEDNMSSNSATAVASQQSIKAYVDSVAQGLNLKESCRVATTGAGTLSSSFKNGDTIDGVTLSTGDRILIKDQSTASENGIYVVKSSGAPDRSGDMSVSDTASGDFTFITEGTINGDNGFVCTSNSGSDTVGTHNLSFTQFSGAGQITAGDGLTKSGNTLSIDAKSNSGIVIDSTELSLDLGASSITGTLAVSDGGTGATSFSDKGVIITQDSGTDTLAAAVMDANGELLIGGTSGPAVATLSAGSNITITNSDGGISIASTDTNTQLTDEQVQDIVGAMFSSNTETGISATYQDSDGTIDLVVGTLNQNTTGNADTSTLASTVTVTDSTANTNFPIVFHNESNALLDDTGSFTYNPSTGNLGIAGHIIPNASNTYDLGSSDNFFRELYLAGDTLHLGDTDIKTDNNGDIEFVDKSNNNTRRKLVADEIILGSGSNRLILKKNSSTNRLEMKNKDDNSKVAMTQDDIGTLGTFTGSSIQDNRTLKEALQDLETKSEKDATTSAKGIASFSSSFFSVSSGAVSLNAAQTSVTSLLATDIKIGEDDQTKIDFEDVNKINFYANNEKQLILEDGALYPGSDNIIDLGKSDNEFKNAYFNGTVTSDAFSGPLTGNADTSTLATLATSITATANNSADETVYLTFVDGATGTQGIETDTGLNYNPSSGVLTTTSVTGNLTGNVTGDISGSAGSCTGNAATSTALANARTIHGVSFDGTGNIDLSEVVQDTVGAMFSSNTETGITATYQDSDGTIDLVVGTLNQDTTGNADTSTLASTVTVTDSTANTDFPVVFHNESNALLDDTGSFTYNPSSGTLSLTGPLTVGVDDIGHDIKFFGATTGAYMLWDESEDDLIVRKGRILVQNAGGDSKFIANTNGNVTTTDLTVSGGDINYNNGQDATLSIDATTSTTAGRDLTISAGSTATGSANIDGGDLHLKSGGGDGTGTSIMTFSTKVSGTDTAAERMRIHTDGSIGIGTNSPSEKLEVYPDTNISAIFGRTHIGHMGHSDWAGFSHVDMNATGSYGLLQSSTGITLLNAADTQYIDFRLNNVSKMKLNADGDFEVGNDIKLNSDASTIKFGANDEITLTHVHDTGLTLTNTISGTDNRPIVFKLKSEEDDIVADDVIGALEFTSGDSDGTDASTNCVGIYAVAEGTFTSSANATKLVFTTGESEDSSIITNASATAKMTLSSEGNLTVGGHVFGTGSITYHKVLNRSLSIIYLTTTFKEIHSDLRIKVKINKSNITLGFYSGAFNANSRHVRYEIYDWNNPSKPHASDFAFMSYGTTRKAIHLHHTLTGLTPGNTYYFAWRFKTSSSNSYVYASNLYSQPESYVIEHVDGIENSHGTFINDGDS